MSPPEVSRKSLLAEKERTLEHCQMVHDTLGAVANILRVRGRNHDRSKFSSYELPYFAAADDLKKVPYGSKHYKSQIDVGSMLRPAIEHHWRHNRHHPEYFENGMQGMNIVDVVEMLCDWLAACERHGDDHNIFHSINVNRMRFKIPIFMASIMWNTALEVFGEEPPEGMELTSINECLTCGRWQDVDYEECQECASATLRIV